MVVVLARLSLVPKYGMGVLWVVAAIVCSAFIGNLITDWDADLSVFNSISIAAETLTLGYPVDLIRPTTLSFDKIARIEMGMAPNWNRDPNFQTLEIVLRDGSAIVTTREIGDQESEEIQSALEFVAYPHCVTSTEQDEDTAEFVWHRAIWTEYFGTDSLATTQGQGSQPPQGCL